MDTLKNKLKEMIKDVREQKKYIKENAPKKYVGSEQWKLVDFRRSLRHHHVAHAMSLGTPYEQIETTTEKAGEIDFNLVNKIQLTYMEAEKNAIEKDVCVDPQGSE